MDLGRLLLRGVVGPLFVGHGTQKLFGWFGGHGVEGTGGFFENLGLRPGKRHATAAGWAEAGGGALLTLGAFTRYGDAGADVLPIGDLMRTEVAALASDLGVPQSILDRPAEGRWGHPAGDAAMGIRYADLERYLMDGPEGVKMVEAGACVKPGDRHYAECGAAKSAPIEKQIAEIWREVLGLDCIGVHDNFLELGGDSLLAAQLISRVSSGLRAPSGSFENGPPPPARAS